MKNLLKKYPRWFYSLIVGFFIYFFLKVFKPFGFQYIPNKILEPLILGYALIGFLLVLLNYIVLGRFIERLFPEKRSLWRQFVWPFWIIITITFANILFSKWYFLITGVSTPSNFKSWPVIVGTITLGAFCIVLIELIDQNIQLKQNLATISYVNKKLKIHLEKNKEEKDRDPIVEFTAQNGKIVLKLSLSRISLISAEENYVAVHYFQDREKRELIRNTISSIEEQLSEFSPVLFRCHRKYIVNIKKISSITGNAQGFRLYLKDGVDPVPVSRRYVPRFRRVSRGYF